MTNSKPRTERKTPWGATNCTRGDQIRPQAQVKCLPDEIL